MKTNEKKRASSKGSQTFSKMIKGKWLIILVIVGVVYGLSQIVLDIDNDPMGVGGFSGIATEQEQEYYTLCAEGDFVGAKKVLNSFYNEYTQEFGKWRGGAWNDREARQKQQQYHTAMAYNHLNRFSLFFIFQTKIPFSPQNRKNGNPKRKIFHYIKRKMGIRGRFCHQ